MIPITQGRAACGDHLDLVDAAYDRPGGPEAHLLREQVCPRCPIAELCFLEGAERDEGGVWGGVGPHQRHKYLLRRPRRSVTTQEAA
jgi:hypothetical protein